MDRLLSSVEVLKSDGKTARYSIYHMPNKTRCYDVRLETDDKTKSVFSSAFPLTFKEEEGRVTIELSAPTVEEACEHFVKTNPPPETLTLDYGLDLLTASSMFEHVDAFKDGFKNFKASKRISPLNAEGVTNLVETLIHFGYNVGQDVKSEEYTVGADGSCFRAAVTTFTRTHIVGEVIDGDSVQCLM